MTSEELCERYAISANFLKEYSALEVRESSGNQYDDKDVKYISMMAVLKEIGFRKAEIKEYMRMYIAGSNAEKRKNMLNKKRVAMLEKIHADEERLSKIDYLRYRMRKKAENVTYSEKSMM